MFMRICMFSLIQKYFTDSNIQSNSTSYLLRRRLLNDWDTDEDEGESDNEDVINRTKIARKSSKSCFESSDKDGEKGNKENESKTVEDEEYSSDADDTAEYERYATRKEIEENYSSDDNSREKEIDELQKETEDQLAGDHVPTDFPHLGNYYYL